MKEYAIVCAEKKYSEKLSRERERLDALEKRTASELALAKLTSQSVVLSALAGASTHPLARLAESIVATVSATPEKHTAAVAEIGSPDLREIAACSLALAGVINYSGVRGPDLVTRLIEAAESLRTLENMRVAKPRPGRRCDMALQVACATAAGRMSEEYWHALDDFALDLSNTTSRGHNAARTSGLLPYLHRYNLGGNKPPTDAGSDGGASAGLTSKKIIEIDELS